MICEVCGAVFTGHGNQRVCGVKCARERHRVQQRDLYNKHHDERRAVEVPLVVLVEGISSVSSQR